MPEQPTLMFAVSTQQNTTNLIPAIQLGVTHVVLVETAAASRNDWSEGLKRVLAQRGIRSDGEFPPIRLKPDEDSRIDRIMDWLQAYLSKRVRPDTRVIWNLGGGQKPQSIALAQVFFSQANLGRPHEACYALARPYRLQSWHVASGHLQCTEQLTNVDLTAEEVLTTFGVQIVSQDTCIYSRHPESVRPLKEVPDWLDTPEVREYLYKHPQTKAAAADEETSLSVKEIQADLETKKEDLAQEVRSRLDRDIIPHAETEIPSSLFNRFVKGIREYIPKLLRSGRQFDPIPIESEKLKEYLGKAELPVDDEFITRLLEASVPKNQTANAAIYLEAILAQRVVRLLETTDSHAVSEVHLNLEVSNTGDRRKSGEYDLLLVTQWGTLIALDAKTFNLVRKEYDASRYLLEKAGGRYVSLVPVFPYFPADIEKGVIPTKLKELPHSLKSNGIREFMVFTHPTAPYSLPLSKKQKQAQRQGENIPPITCQPVEHLLDYLKLSVSPE